VIRLATLKNGRRYVVDRIDFDKEIVHTWDEVVSVKFPRRRRGGPIPKTKFTHKKGSKQFLLGMVEIAEVDQDFLLGRVLLFQAAEVLGLEVECGADKARRQRAARELGHKAFQQFLADLRLMGKRSL
jgi:hypothetical protein